MKKTLTLLLVFSAVFSLAQIATAQSTTGLSTSTLNCLLAGTCTSQDILNQQSATESAAEQQATAEAQSAASSAKEQIQSSVQNTLNNIKSSANYFLQQFQFSGQSTTQNGTPSSGSNSGSGSGSGSNTTTSGGISQTTGDVSVEFSPTTPGPDQTVTATASSFNTDLNSASIAWFVDGKMQKTGTGLTSFTFTMGPSGQTTTIDVVVNTTDNQVIKQTFALKPDTVDLIWQADSYTPPFYEGKALFSHEERIEFVAVPHILNSNGTEIPAGDLVYKWTRNGTVIGNFSGYGKSTYTLISSVISVPLDIQVEVTTTNNSGDIADAETVATPIEPSVVFYRRDPLYGIQFQNALAGSFALTGSEMDVLAEPFFFGDDDISAGNLQYSWSINGNSIDSDTTRTDRVFRPQDGTSGTSNISLSVANSDKILQMADNNFNLSFSSLKQ